MRLLAVQGGKLAQQVLLLVAELAWRNDDNLHVLVALSDAAQTRNAFAFKPEERTRLRSGRNFQLDLLGQRRDLDLIAKRRLGKGERTRAEGAAGCRANVR